MGVVALSSRMSWLAFCVLFIQSVPTFSQDFTNAEKQLINNAVEVVMKCKNIPGLGISLVRNGSVLNKGYGHARLDPPVAFDENTVSNIGSTSKAFTAALLGVLITESKQRGTSIGWNSKVADILGRQFQASSALLTSELTIKDMLTHRTGCKSQGLSFVTVLPNITRTRLSSRMKYLPQEYPFRDVWSYNNYMYMAAGHVAEVIGGKPFETLMKEKILNPLGMNASFFIDDESARDEHFAYPYFVVNGNFSFSEDDWLLYRIHGYSPAGGLCSSSRDLSKWLTFLLGNGTTVDGQTLIDKDVFGEMFQPHVSLPSALIKHFSLKKPYPVFSSTSWYGYAWFGRNYRGHSSLTHRGNFHAYNTISYLYPDAKSGFFMMINGPWPVQVSTTIEPLSYVFSDILLQEDPWLNISSICAFPEPWEKLPASKNKTVEKIPTDNYDVTPCIGSFGHRIYGDITTSTDSPYGNITFKINLAGEGNLTRVKDDTFRMDFIGKLPLIVGSNCKARFDVMSGGLFQKIHVSCVGSYDFERGVRFLADDPLPSKGTLPVSSITMLMMWILFFAFQKY